MDTPFLTDYTSPLMNTPFLDSSSTVDTPFLDHFDATSEEFISFLFGQEPQTNDVYVAGYLGPTATCDPTALLLNNSKTQETLFPPLKPQEDVPQPKQTKKTKRNKTAARLHQCPFCDHKSKRKFNLQTHIKTHDKLRIKEFPCSTCHKRFDRRHDRDRHQVTVHAKNKHNPCHVCNLKFTRFDALERHLLSKHNIVDF